jgi:hypothetical protein
MTAHVDRGPVLTVHRDGYVVTGVSIDGVPIPGFRRVELRYDPQGGTHALLELDLWVEVEDIDLRPFVGSDPDA